MKIKVNFNSKRDYTYEFALAGTIQIGDYVLVPVGPINNTNYSERYVVGKVVALDSNYDGPMSKVLKVVTKDLIQVEGAIPNGSASMCYTGICPADLSDHKVLLRALEAKFGGQVRKLQDGRFRVFVYTS